MNKTTKAVIGSKPATAMDESKCDITVPQPACFCKGKCDVCKCKREASR